MNHRYPVILLDADDTLLDFDRAETAAVSGTLARAGLDPTPAVLSRYKEINRRSWEALERGECQKDEMLWRRFQTLFRENGLDFDPREANRDYRARLSRCALSSLGRWSCAGSSRPRAGPSSSSPTARPRCSAAGWRCPA